MTSTLERTNTMPLIDVSLPPLAMNEVAIEHRAHGTAERMTVQKVDVVIGICHLSENPFDPRSAVSVMGVVDEAVWYLKKREDPKTKDQARVTVLQMPKHGILKDVGGGNFAYDPTKGYIGEDRATLLVELDGKTVKMEYYFRVMQAIPQSYETGPNKYQQSNCPRKSAVWKISTFRGVNDKNT